MGLTAFTPEAVRELQVVTAPFDVRYGNFAGGLINAVTRSGSNRVEGSMVGYLEGAGLSGTDSTGSRGEDFNRKEFGLTLGAPIVRDRVAIFLNASLRRQVFPQSMPAPTSDTTGGADSAGVGIRYQSLVRLQGAVAGPQRGPGKFLGRAVSRTDQEPLRQGDGAARSEQPARAVPQLRPRQRPAGNRPPRAWLLFPLLERQPDARDHPCHEARLDRGLWPRFSNELTLARVDDRRICFPTPTFRW